MINIVGRYCPFFQKGMKYIVEYVQMCVCVCFWSGVWLLIGAHTSVLSSIPGWGTCRGQLIDISLSHQCSSLSRSSGKVFSGEDQNEEVKVYKSNIFKNIFYWLCYYSCPISPSPFIPLHPAHPLPPALLLQPRPLPSPCPSLVHIHGSYI